MTVVPIPVAPTSAEPAPLDAGADTEAAPGFANMLDAAQGQDASESTGTVAGDAQSGGEGHDGGEKPANALTDATVVALLAALNGVPPQPAPPEPVVVVDVTAAGIEGDVTAADAEVVTPTISIVDATETTEPPAEPVAVAPAPLTDDATEPASTPPAAPTEPEPPAPTTARPDTGAVAVVVDTEASVPQVASTPVTPSTDADKPAPVSATAFTAVTPPVVATAEGRAAAPVAPTAPATAPAPPVPAEQVVSVLRPLRRAADGTYELRLQLRPPELGQIELRVEMRHGVLHAALQADNPQAVEIMRNGLNELRSRLEAEGVRAGTLTVDSNATQTSQRDRDSQRETHDGGDALGAPVEPIAAAVRSATDDDALLDVRI
jgi:hypothetical protein